MQVDGTDGRFFTLYHDFFRSPGKKVPDDRIFAVIIRTHPDPIAGTQIQIRSLL